MESHFRMNVIYGPVPSRRLGMSLGIDPIPQLTCTFDCVYCQLGRKRRKVRGPAEIEEPFPAPTEIVAQVKTALGRHENIDYITFAGSGEPTLSPHLATVVGELRQISRLPIALVTNSSLLTDHDVLATAALFDLVLPSLDAGDQKTFLRVNRPAPGFEIDMIALAISRLARKVPIWLEVMLVESEKSKTNIDPDAIGRIIEKIKLIRPHEVNLNTCVRPPEEAVYPIPEQKLLAIRERMESVIPGIPIVVVPKRTAARSKLVRQDELSEEILKILAVRPCTPVDLSDALGINPAEIGKYLARLAEDDLIGQSVQKGQIYYISKR